MHGLPGHLEKAPEEQVSIKNIMKVYQGQEAKGKPSKRVNCLEGQRSSWSHPWIIVVHTKGAKNQQRIGGYYVQHLRAEKEPTKEGRKEIWGEGSFGPTKSRKEPKGVIAL